MRGEIGPNTRGWHRPKVTARGGGWRITYQESIGQKYSIRIDEETIKQSEWTEQRGVTIVGGGKVVVKGGEWNPTQENGTGGK